MWGEGFFFSFRAGQSSNKHLWRRTLAAGQLELIWFQSFQQIFRACSAVEACYHLSTGANELWIVTVVRIFCSSLKAVGWDQGQRVYTGKSSSSTPNLDHFLMQLEWFLHCFLNVFLFVFILIYFYRKTVQNYLLIMLQWWRHLLSISIDVLLHSICAEFDSTLQVIKIVFSSSSSSGYHLTL